MRVCWIFAAALAAGSCGRAIAEGDPGSGGKLRDLCTDRPTKNTAPCTVDPGHLQLESDVFNVVFDRTGGVDTNTYLFTNPTLKLGVTHTLDLEAGLAPVVEVTTRDRASGLTSRTTGIGDLYLRAKLNLAGDDGGRIGLAILPYLKIPTAKSGIGNGAVEGGVLVPISVSLPGKFNLALTPELDVLKDQAGDGRHLNVVNPIAITRAVGAVTFAAEFWSDVNFDPAGEVTQYSADLGVSYIPPKQPNLQFDGGVNLGLNGVTPGVLAYVGVSRRF